MGKEIPQEIKDRVGTYLNRNPNIEDLFHIASTLITWEHDIVTVALYVLNPEGTYFESRGFIGPDDPEDHKKILHRIRSKSLEARLFESPLKDAFEKPLQLREEVLNYPIHVADAIFQKSRFSGCIKKGSSFFGIDEEGYKKGAIDQKVEEIFGTDEYALITVKDKTGVIGIYYVDYRFSPDIKLVNGSGAILAKKDFRFIERISSSTLQIIRASEREVYIEAMKKGLQNVAHELSSPMVGVIGLLNRLYKYTDDPEKTRSTLDLVYNQARRVERVIKRLQDPSKIDEPVPSYFNIYDKIIEGMKILEIEGEKRGWQYEVQKPNNQLMGYADPELIEQIFMGLAKNALQNIEEDPDKKGILKVSFLENDKYHLVLLHNEQYIPEKHQPFIFDEGYTTREKGTGFGLAFYEKLNWLNGGYLMFQSSLGIGTIFRIQIPKNEGVFYNKP